MPARQPTLYIPHGGGPYSYVDLGQPPGQVAHLVDQWRSIGDLQPTAVIVISAHWEAGVPTVQTATRPPMLYDYSGFPAAAYELQWPAPGSPQLAARVRSLLTRAGIPSAEDAERGYDHGTFVPMGRSFPRADVPTIQLSLVQGLDPAAHLAIGRALAPLRDEGVLLLGSGMSYHNMRGFRAAAADGGARAFDAWLSDTARADPDARHAALLDWETAPSARAVHPRAEHLLPLMVVSGAAHSEPGAVTWRGTVFGKPVSAVQFG